MTDFTNRNKGFLTRKVVSKGEHLGDTCKLTDWANFTKKYKTLNLMLIARLPLNLPISNIL